MTVDDAAGVPPRGSQMVSLRLDGDVLAALRSLAAAQGTTVSELLREGATGVIAAHGDRTRPARVRYVSSGPVSWVAGSYDVLMTRSPSQPVMSRPPSPPPHPPGR